MYARTAKCCMRHFLLFSFKNATPSATHFKRFLLFVHSFPIRRQFGFSLGSQFSGDLFAFLYFGDFLCLSILIVYVFVCAPVLLSRVACCRLRYLHTHTHIRFLVRFIFGFVCVRAATNGVFRSNYYKK